MARRHFDGTGLPKTEEIIREICQYVGGLGVVFTGRAFRGDVIDLRPTRYGSRIISRDADFVQDVSKNPFKVNRIYVVGGQVRFLPESYNGERDLDMIVETNAGEVASFPQVTRDICYKLSKILNNGMSPEFIIETNRKRYVLDLFLGPVKPPYLQIYPLLQKVE